MPFDIYRVALFIALVIIGAILFTIDIFVFYPNLKGNTGFFQINYHLLNSGNWWLLVIVALLSIPVYMGLETISVRYYDYRIKPKYVKKGSL